MSQIYEILIRGRLTPEGQRYEPQGSHVVYATMAERPGKPGEFVPVLSDPIPLHLENELPKAIASALANSHVQVAEAEARVKQVEEETAKKVAEVEDAAKLATREAEKACADRVAEVEASLALRDQELSGAVANLANAEAEIAALKERIAQLEAPPSAPRTYFSDLWRRASDEESEKIEAAIQSLSVKERNLLNSSQYLAHDDAAYPRILEVLTALFGAERAAYLLKASEG